MYSSIADSTYLLSRDAWKRQIWMNETVPAAAEGDPITTVVINQQEWWYVAIYSLITLYIT